MKLNKLSHYSFLFSGLLALAACAPATPGPDKQFVGSFGGAVAGAGAGAVTGFQVSSAAGPGAAVGAGFGAVAGGIRGFLKDKNEDSLMRLAAETNAERRRSIAQEVLADNYSRRMDLHPSREIYPADLFFVADEAKLRSCAKDLVREMAIMYRGRMPWSRLQIVSYVKTTEKTSEYARGLTQNRAKAIFNEFVNAGIEPRRIDAKAVLMNAPLVLDPDDYPTRYDQAIEIVLMDK